jgi:hypothetical protein
MVLAMFRKNPRSVQTEVLAQVPNFVTMDKGEVRLITVSRPDNQGLLTLSNPRGMHFTPACTPVVIKRLGEQVPHLGFVHPGAPDYEFYKGLLVDVVPNYGLVGQMPVIE